MSVRCIIILLATCFFGSTVAVGATSLDTVSRDFRPLSGYIVKSMGDAFLIDQDAGKGVAVGDFFAVITQGEQIVHPVTKEVLGNIAQTKGILRVTRTATGYSYARLEGKSTEFNPGDVIRRYENIPAIFWDYTEQGAGFFPRLKDALPHLNWQGYVATQADRPETPGPLLAADPTLLFVLDKNGLHVYDNEFRSIHTYPQFNVSIKATAALSSEKQIKWEQSPNSDGVDAAGYHAIYSGFETLGPLPEGTIMAAFARAGDHLLLASTDGSIFQAFAVDSKLTPLTQGDTGRPGKILALHWWQPTVDGPLYLAVTSSVEENQAATSFMPHTISGSIFQLQDDLFRPVIEGLPYILGSFDRDGDGVSETLLGQNFDRDIFFGGRIQELSIVDDKVETRRTDLIFPRGFPVQGSLLADLTGDGKAEAIFVRRQTLFIYTGKQLLYESAQQMGGSLSSMTYSRNPGAVDQLFTTESFEVSPVAADLDGDGLPEVVALSSDGSSLHAQGFGSGSKAQLAVFRNSNSSFIRGRLGDEIESPVQGLFLDGKRALLVSSKAGHLDGKGYSYLLALPLAK